MATTGANIQSQIDVLAGAFVSEHIIKTDKLNKIETFLNGGKFYHNIPENRNTFVLKFNNMLYSIKIGDELSDWKFDSTKG